jgi:DNA-binding transcriptional ArsR family regulator
MAEQTLKKTEQIANFGKALSDPTRQRIMQLCCCQWRNVGEIVDMTGMAQSTVSHHLSKLLDFGFIHIRHEGKMAFYQLNQQAISKCCVISADVFAPLIDK